MDTDAPMVPATPAPSAPAPTQTPAPAQQSAPPPGPMRVMPTINTAGDPVDPFGNVVRPGDNSDVIDFGELDKPKSKAAAKPAAPKPAAKTETPAPTTDVKTETPTEQPSPFELPKVETPANTTRNYADMPEEVAAIAKKLPNVLYNHLRATFQKFDEASKAKDAELAELKKQAESRVTADHPEAYRIDPEYTKAVQTYGALRGEIDHYVEQLAAIDAGEGWRIITGYNQAGDPIYQEIPASADGKVDYSSRVKVQQAINNMTAKQQQIQLQAEQIRNQYAGSAEEVAKHYQEAESRLFKGISPESLSDEAEKNIYKLAIDALPRTERGRRSARMLGLAAVVVRRSLLQQQALLERAERAERLLSSGRAASPVAAAPAPGSPVDDLIPFDE